MSWDPRDDEPVAPYRRSNFYRNSASMCDCDMCNEDPADEGELEPEDVE